MLILFDQGTPVPLRQFLSGHTVRTAAEFLDNVLARHEAASYVVDHHQAVRDLGQDDDRGDASHVTGGLAACITSIIKLSEAYYRLVRVERREQAESLWRMALRRTLPVAVKGGDGAAGTARSELKANHAIAYADAFAVSTALKFRATLTGDPEIKPLELYGNQPYGANQPALPCSVSSKRAAEF